MSKSLSFLRKLLVLLIGLPLLVLGIILIPLPGPGVLVSLVALLILSTEFNQAVEPLNKAKAVIKKIYNESKERADRISKD